MTSEAESPTAATDVDADVVIVGAGPVGSALAVDLALAGVRTTVLEEREQGQRPHPGTNLTNVRSMEHMRRWGATPHLRASNPLGPQFARDVVFPARVHGPEVTRMKGAFDFSENLPFASALPHFGPQESIERGLRARLAELPAAEIRYSSTFERFIEDDDGVEVVYRDRTGAETSVTGSYLVGCDGSRSLVRRQLGIRMEGTRGLVNATIWYVFSPELRDLIAEHLGGAVFCWFVNEDKTGVNVLAQNDDGLFQFFDCPIEDGVDGSDWEVMKERLLRAVGRYVPVEPVEGGGFKVNSVVATEFHRGRVFLAGESAHHISVFGGFGMNTGIGDAADLGWKLAGAVHGWAGPELLASYDAERIPVVRWIRDLTEESTKHVAYTWSQSGMEAPGPEGDAIRNAIGDEILAVKSAEVMSFGAQFGAAYYDSPIITSDGTRPPAATFGAFTPSASPGVRAPHMWLEDGTSVLDHVALEGFTLLRLDAGIDAQPFEDAAAEREIPFAVATILNDALRELYESDLALIRPDHYVAWRGSAVPDDPAAVLDTARGARAAEAAAASAEATASA
jgi:2-polyprenyl-6-methoxyphenol hydroxylase-like FAD-dependent oxidoreductase